MNDALRLIPFAALLISLTAGAQEENIAVIYAKNGKPIEANIIDVSTTQLSYRNPGGRGSTKLDYKNIETIEFPENPVFSEAEEKFRQLDYEGAASLYKKLSLLKNKTTYYPAINNFATLSERRLIDTYRLLHRPFDLNYISEKIEWDKLPTSEKQLPDVVECWSLVGREKWDAAITKCDAVQAKMALGDPNIAELGYLRGLAYLGKNEPDLAVVSFGEAYGPYPGHDIYLTGEAMKQTAKILQNLPEQQAELKAIVHLYAALIGNGDVWEEAPPLINKLLSEPITSVGPISKASRAAGDPDQGLLARFVRIELGSSPKPLFLAEVEVMSGGYNIAKNGKAKQSSNNPNRSSLTAEKAIDGVTNGTIQGGSVAMTKVQKGAWWELDLRKVKKIGSVKVWNRTGDPRAVSMIEGFKLTLLDGKRKVVFSKKGNEAPSPSLEIVIEAPDKVKDSGTAK